MDEPWFWCSTPYMTGLATNARRKARSEESLLSGWAAEWFAREKTLRGFSTYMAETDENAGQALAEADLTRWAASHGLEVTDVEGATEG